MTSSFRRDTISSGNYSSMSMLENQEQKQKPRYEVRFTNKNHPFMWLVYKTRTKILLSDPETSPMTPRLLPLRRSRRSYGNYQSPQSSGSSRNILKRLWDDPDDHMETRLKGCKLQILVQHKVSRTYIIFTHTNIAYGCV